MNNRLIPTVALADLEASPGVANSAYIPSSSKANNAYSVDDGSIAVVDSEGAITFFSASNFNSAWNTTGQTVLGAVVAGSNNLATSFLAAINALRTAVLADNPNATRMLVTMNLGIGVALSSGVGNVTFSSTLILVDGVQVAGYNAPWMNVCCQGITAAERDMYSSTCVFILPITEDAYASAVYSVTVTGLAGSGATLGSLIAVLSSSSSQ